MAFDRRAIRFPHHRHIVADGSRRRHDEVRVEVDGCRGPAATVHLHDELRGGADGVRELIRDLAECVTHAATIATDGCRADQPNG